MRISDFRADDTPEISLVPLIDVVLCLIIFFVVTTTFESRSVLKLQLPRAEASASTPDKDALDLLVNADGHYFVGDREALRTDVESLKRTIGEVAGTDRNRTVMLRADARTPHQAVVTALDALGQLGFRNISIGTAPDVRAVPAAPAAAGVAP